MIPTLYDTSCAQYYTILYCSTMQVSWIRAGDVSVLSVGHLAFSSDKRISVVQVFMDQGPQSLMKDNN